MNNTNEEFRSQDSTQLSKKYVVQTWLPTIYYTTNIHARKKTDSQSEESITEQEDLNLG